MSAPPSPAVPENSGLNFQRTVWMLCLLFVTVQALYIVRQPLVMDEFQNAFAAYRVAEQVPYRDFAPYKTVLGYYLQLPLLQWVEGAWRPLLAVKFQMALITAVVLAWASLRLRRHFDSRSIVLGLGMLLAMSTFLERSAALRLDMATALAGLVGLVLLLDRRFALAGIATAISFLLSQKGVYYVLAANFALGSVWLLAERTRRQLRAAVVFNLAALATLGAYLGLWAAVASLDAVLRATFFSHGEIAFGNLYDNQLKYWSQTLRRNPLFYLMSLLGLKTLIEGRPATLDRHRRLTLAVYGATLIVLSIQHRQPWPYFFVLLIPTLWLLVIAFLDATISGWEDRSLWAQRSLIAIVVIGGFLVPLLRIVPTLRRDSGFQRSTVLLADRLATGDDSYLAGTELLFKRPQAIRQLSWLDIPRSRWLRDQPAYDLERLRHELDLSATKIVVNNYRIYGLPTILRNHLARTYLPWWGAIAIYAPTIRPEHSQIDIRFDGTYELMGSPTLEVSLGGLAYQAGDHLDLEAGEHGIQCSETARLRYIPQNVDDLLDPDHRESQLLFPEVYTY